MPTPVAIAYTSTQPITGLPSPLLYDASYPLADLPIAALQLYAAGFDTGDAGATFTYQWSVIDAPPGATATFSNPNAQNPTFGTIDPDHWGNYRLMCVVTSSAGRVSESRKLYAPDSAFVNVRLESNALGLQKPARFERDWQAAIRKYAEKIEQVNTDLIGQTIAQHSDVSSATGPKLDQLVNGSYAIFGMADMHLHTGTQVDVATTSTRGTVLLDATPADAYNPRAINEERLIFNANFNEAATASPTAAAAFPLLDDLTIENVKVLILNGETAGETTAFSLFSGTEADFLSNALTPVSGGVLSGAPTNNGDPLLLSWTPSPSLNLSAGSVLAIICTAQAPTTPAKLVTVTITALRKV